MQLIQHRKAFVNPVASRLLYQPLGRWRLARRAWLLIVVAAPFLGSSSATALPPVTIWIQRQLVATGCTGGSIGVNDGVAVASTLELGPVGNIQTISSVPAGTYPASLHLNGTKGWKIDLHEVPNRSLVEIHLGNYTSNTIGAGTCPGAVRSSTPAPEGPQDRSSCQSL